jgi:Tfp pilus assembly protein FimT
MKLHHDERGLKGVELGMALLMVGILAALAIPLMSRVESEVNAVAALAGQRAAAIEQAASPADDDAVQVAGVRLERAADGATCRWTTSAGGTVYGVWESGSRSLYGSFAVAPATCPSASEAEAAGFGASFVGP